MKTQNRYYGIDLLKILTMIGIIVLHLNSIGGVLKISNESQYHFLVSNFLEIAFLCSVNVFAMISGFLMYKKESFNSYRIFELISTILLYAIILYLISCKLYPEEYHGVSKFFDTLRMLTVTSYWYFTNYIPVVILAPFINKIINLLEDKQFSFLCFLLFFLFSIIPSILDTDFFITKKGYSFVWLLICYVIGAYIRKNDFKINSKLKCITIILVNSFVVLNLNYVLALETNVMHEYLFSYCSPLILINGAVFIILFKDLNFGKAPNAIKKLIILSGMSSFDVYIIHTHFLFFKILFKDKFTFVINHEALLIPIILIGSASVLFIIFSIIGIIRIKLFKVIKLEKIFSKITKNKLSYDINDLK